MSRKKGIRVVVIAAAAASIILAMTSFYQYNTSIPADDNNNNNNGMAPSPPSTGANGTGGGEGPTQKIPVSALSSPSALPIVEKWIAQYNSERKLGSVKVNYSDRVDDDSIALLYSNISFFLADRSADFAIASRPVATRGNFTYAGSVFLPVSPQAVAVVYNIPALPDVPSGLRLDSSTLYAVLSGNATFWDDSRIKSLNSDTNLPHERIVVVHEGQAGSGSDLLGRYLASKSNGTLTWPESSLVADSSNALSAIVRQTPYSIGYVDFAFAAQARMTYASLQNSDGQYLAPSVDSISAAVSNGTIVDPALVNGTGLRSPTLVAPPTISVGQLGNGSYPIVGFYYAVFADYLTNFGANETARQYEEEAVLDFVQWMAGSEGQQILKDMRYPSVYDQNKDLEAFANRVLGRGTELLTKGTY